MERGARFEGRCKTPRTGLGRLQHMRQERQANGNHRGYCQEEAAPTVALAAVVSKALVVDGPYLGRCPGKRGFHREGVLGDGAVGDVAVGRQDAVIAVAKLLV